jgi:acyl-coenzyme A thioesterase PaaI-like protein
MIEAGKRIAHHDLCFGCGLSNRFGLQLELEPAAHGGVRGRFFVKQDHQGPRGLIHGGVAAAGLEEAMSLAVGRESLASTASLELDLRGWAPVGTYVQVSARVERREGTKRWAVAELRDEDGELVAEGRGLFLAHPDAG